VVAVVSFCYWREQEPLTLQAGTLLDSRYRIVELVATSNSITAYRAHHELIDREIIIKVLNLDESDSDADLLARFQQEAKTLSLMNHPALLTVYDCGVIEDGAPYLVMDHIEGVSLAEVLQKEGALPLERALNIFAQVCDGLAYVHKRGVIHRDLKPDSIIFVGVYKNERVKVIDFGIAKLLASSPGTTQRLTRTGELKGNPVYIAPEQCLGRQPDARTDIYSLGCIMYETISGHPPFEGGQPLEIMSRHVNEVPQPLTAGHSGLNQFKKLNQIVLKCLAKKPDDRFRSAAQLSQELKALKQPGASRKPGKLALVATSTVCIMLLVGFILAGKGLDAALARISGWMQDLQPASQALIDNIERSTDALEREGHWEQALDSARRCVRRSRERYGEQSVAVAKALNKVAVLAEKLNDKPSARKAASEALEILVDLVNKRREGETKADTLKLAQQVLFACENGANLQEYSTKDLLNIMYRIALALPDDFQARARFKLAGRAVVDLARSRQQDCQTSVSVISCWAECYARMQDPQESLELRREALSVMDSCPDFAGMVRPMTLRAIALSSANQDSLPRKELLLRQAVDLIEQDAHPTMEMLAEANLSLAENLLKQEKWKESRIYFERALSISLEAIKGLQKPQDLLSDLEHYINSSSVQGDDAYRRKCEGAINTLSSRWHVR
jgi:tRNA A-37 threonylcarbamoyl transferase component Bud32/tetratricopeptide (TPR) repeat protein